MVGTFGGRIMMSMTRSRGMCTSWDFYEENLWGVIYFVLS